MNSEIKFSLVEHLEVSNKVANYWGGFFMRNYLD